jgi:hypothetical protein
MTSKSFLKPFVTVPVAPVITCIIIHFMFHIHCCILASLPQPFAQHFYCHMYQCASFLFFVFNYYIWPILL